MAALTQSAIDALLGALATAIQDEVQLVSGVHSDMKFIKDEMDSMNGFLLHLNKMESEHDDQVRAWMKQVREVSYIGEDCVDRYRRFLDRYGAGWAGGGCTGTISCLAFVLRHPMAYSQLDKLGKQIAELKVRVQEVSQRRKRYDVNVPAGRDLKMVQTNLPDQMEEKREVFVHALEKDVVGTHGWFRSTAAAPDLLEDAVVSQLPDLVTGSPEAVTMMRDILKKCCPARDHPSAGGAEAAAFRCTRKMFLCAMYVVSSQELKKLKEKVVGVTAEELKKDNNVGNQDKDEQPRAAGVTDGELKTLKKDNNVGEDNKVEKPRAGVVGAQEARKQVMLFCYSILTTQQKSCLQYLTAFLHESEISRTSMVRRWVAEGLLGKDKDPAEGVRTTTTPEEAGERCFRELLLRGFIRAARWSDAGTVKSCVMDDAVSDFIQGITKSENFLAELPAHLNRQLSIRSIVQRRALPPPPPRMLVRRCNLCCCGGGGCTWLLEDHRASEDDAATAKDPMDELVDFIRRLPELYRLNVLDLGGCTGLKRRHLKSFAEVECLKYLSLRDTDVSRLHVTQINKLALLETLDIRGTYISPRDTMSIYLPKLKHLLAGRFIKTTTTTMPAVDKASLVTVHMPDSIGLMTRMETLSHVQVSMYGAELKGVAELNQLRKLGVVVHANNSTAALLGRVLYMLAANLRSLSIWVVAIADRRTSTTQHGVDGGGSTTGGILDVSSMHEMPSSLALENLDIKGKTSLPSWIGRTSKLANVTLRDTEMDGGDALRRLATVESLRCLKLSRKAFTEQVLRFKDVHFQALKFLVVEGDAATRIVFCAKDEAPKLEKIVWVIGGGSKIAKMYNEDLITGIDHLHSIKEIEIRASFNLANLLEWTKPQATTSSTRIADGDADLKYDYHVRYISSSAGNQLITEVPKIKTKDKTLTLPAGTVVLSTN